MFRRCKERKHLCRSTFRLLLNIPVFGGKILWFLNIVQKDKWTKSNLHRMAGRFLVFPPLKLLDRRWPRNACLTATQIKHRQSVCWRVKSFKSNELLRDLHSHSRKNPLFREKSGLLRMTNGDLHQFSPQQFLLANFAVGFFSTRTPRHDHWSSGSG